MQNEQTLSQEIKDKPVSVRGRYRYWFITCNNPEDWKAMLASFQATYAVGQLEKGKNGTPHLQAVLYFANEVSGKYFKDSPCWHKGIVKEDFPRVKNYVTKVETRQDGPLEIGQAPDSMRRSRDFSLAKALAKEGRFEEIDPELYIKYYGSFKKIHAESGDIRDGDEVRGVWMFGRPGYGKSHLAREIYGSSLFLKSQSKWWDGFCNEEYVLLDDFDLNGACLAHFIKIWADKWGAKGEIKGGFTILSYKTFIITSNYLPRDLWPNDQKLNEAISRRFVLVEFVKPFIPICPISSEGEFLNSLIMKKL